MATSSARSFFCLLLTVIYATAQLVQPTPPQAIICRGHADGLYVVDPSACAASFYKCANGQYFHFICPNGLFFSVEDARCEYKSTIPACGGVRVKPQPVQIPTAMAQQLVAPAVPAYRMPPVYQISYAGAAGSGGAMQSAPAQQANAGGDASSNYQSSSYEQSTYGAAAPQPTAAAQQSYSFPSAPAAVAASDYIAPVRYMPSAPLDVQATPASPPPYVAPIPIAPGQQATQSSYSSSSYTSQQAPIAVAARPPPPRVDFDCSGKSEGYYYKQPCQPDYYACLGGQATAMKCPQSTAFDPISRNCEFTAQCGKPQPPTTTTPRPANTPPPSIWCQQNGKGDGTYADGCSTKFYVCGGGRTTEISCPSSMFYDPLIASCDQREFVAVCGGFRRPTTTTVTAPRAVQQSTWCQQNGKSDGTYNNGCSSKFYVCGGGLTTELFCPASMLYDPLIASCDQRQLVAVCGGFRPPSTTTIVPPRASLQQQSTYYNCDSRSDGYYSNGCATSYFSCNGGLATQLKCPGNTRYSPQLHTCDYTENIPECGGRLPTTTVAPPPAPIAAASQSYSSYTNQMQSYQAPQQPQQQAPLAAAAASQNYGYQAAQAAPAPVAPVAESQNYGYQAAQAAPAPVTPVAESQSYSSSYTSQVQSPVAPEAAASTYGATNDNSASYGISTLPTDQIVAPTAVADIEDDSNPCLVMPDGIYGRPCSRQYLVCSSKKTYIFVCPSSYAYDRQLARCGPTSGIQRCSSATAY